MSDSRGFTLLETVVAITILSLVGVGVMGAFAAEQRAALEADQVVAAAALAQDRLARLAIVSREALDPLPDSLRRGTFGAPFDTYEWEADVEEVRGRRHLFDVRVRVSWAPDGRYAARTMLYRPADTAPSE